MNTTVPSPIPKASPSATSGGMQSVASSPTKEHEGRVSVSSGEILPVSAEIEIPPEVEKAGMIVHPEAVDVPLDLVQMGISSAGPTAAVTPATTTVVLPLSDDQVLRGLHMPIVSALHWLAVWCVRQLKKAHIAIKIMHGKIVRVMKS